MMENNAKSVFVERELTALLKKVNKDIEQAEYWVHEETGEEYVKIVFKEGRYGHVCVTADSLIALSRDVLKAVG